MSKKNEVIRTEEQKAAFDAYLERTTPATDVKAELEAKHKAAARKGIFKAEHAHVSVNGKEVAEGPDAGPAHDWEATLDVDDPETLTEAEAEAKSPEFLYPLGSCVKFKLSGLPEEVFEAPSVYNPETMVPHHWKFTLCDASGTEYTLTLYDNQLESFKRGVNRRTDGDLVEKFPNTGRKANGTPAPQNISLCGKWGKATPERREKAAAATAKYWAECEANGEPRTPAQKRNDLLSCLGGVAWYMMQYPVEFRYDYKTRPDGTQTDKPGLCWYYPEQDGPKNRTRASYIRVAF